MSEVKGDATWGDVIVVSDTADNMASGPIPGATFTALQVWLTAPANQKALADGGWDHVLACDSAVNVDPAGNESRLSEMIPTASGGTVRAMRTGQASSSGSGTTIDCP